MNKVTELVLSGKTYKETGDLLGITRQRAQQLNKPSPIVIRQLKARANSRCEYCGILLKHGHVHHITKTNPIKYHQLENLKYLCISCHTRVDSKKTWRICQECGSHYFRSNLSYPGNTPSFCSSQCRDNYFNISLVCPVCGDMFKLTRSVYKARMRHGKRDGFFCSRSCWYKYRLLSKVTDINPLTKVLTNTH